MKNKLLNFVLCALVLMILLVAMAVRGSRSSQVAADVYPAPNELPTATLSRCELEKITNEYKSAQGKPGWIEEEYQRCIAVLTAAPKTRVLKPAETPLPTSPYRYKETRLRRIAGNGVLIEGIMGMPYPRSFVHTNTWYEKSGDRFIYVKGGVKIDPSPDRTHSAVDVTVSDLAGNWLAEGGIYEAPVRAGELTILDAQGELLVLSTPDGQLLFFDVPSRKYLTPDANTITSSEERIAGDGVIIEKTGSPYGDSYIVSNHWIRKNDGKYVSVFAGRKTGVGGQAVILVTTSQGEPTVTDKPEVCTIPGYSDFPTDYPRIFDVHEDKVFLVGKRGAEFVFDLSEKRFLSLAEIAHLPIDANLLALEESYQEIRKKASSNSAITSTTPTAPAYP